MATVTTTRAPLLVRSADGTDIAYDVTGSGPAVVVVEGALCQRSMGTAQALRPLLSQHYSVFAYDRRGRGASGPGRAPYTVEREVEDLAAVLGAAGADACVVGASSGAALVLEAARAGVPMRRIALYEVPFILDGTRSPNDPALGERTQDLVDAGRRSEAVRLFLRTVGVPALGVAMMRVMPVWSRLCGIAHTLPHDYAIVLPHQQGRPLPEGYLAGVRTPALVIAGGKSPTYMRNAQASIAGSLPHGRLEVLRGQSHIVKGKATVPALQRFLVD